MMTCLSPCNANARRIDCDLLSRGDTPHASVLVIAPHPDDDILAAAGVIKRAIGHEEVTVVFMTNGDVESIAQGLSAAG